MRILDSEQWRPLAEDHATRARRLTAAHLERRRRGVKHPLEDFLFDYYGFRPAQLARWQPGPGIGLREASDLAGRRFYATVDGVTSLDLDAFRAARGRALDWALRILTATDAAEPQFACFGLHEWAMVYRQSPDQARHQVIGLRATPEEIARVVEGHEIRCSHWDAFRFFTPDARPRNVLQPDAEAQASFEQPGCLHGGAMDLYRWAFKLDPGVPGDLLLDAFELARRARVLDMRSSPYDVRPFRLTNIAIETADGKAEHVAEQRSIADAAALLRRRLIAVLDALT
ncbi:PH domain-containing protein [Propioniciclava tarda]|uniref:PH domain-containing protein n=1 Tax=Propioniciclava tarda TaxID=433330 RepID=UPI001175C4C7|nr:PH domain-containing protein [Propioniciclava tarda]SMO71119.1 hypothetical protein SAMN06266982_11381 [Propioniciclava tarda]